MNAREELTDILINNRGTWCFKKAPLKNKKILQYFKSNLQRDKKGIYIINNFGELSEKGYIKVHGPLLSIIGLDEKLFYLDDGSILPIKDSRLIINDEKYLFLFLEKYNAWANFSQSALNDLSLRLEEQDDKFYFDGKIIEVIEKINWTENEKLFT